MPPNWTVLLQQALHHNRLSLSEQVIRQLACYLQCLSQWNQVFNLTAITVPREMVYLHIIDSLLMAPFLQGKHRLDVGSGAGLPGVPLALLEPHCHWVLLDKNSKKTRFLTQVMAACDIKNVEIVHSRCENFQSTTRFDSIIFRAVGTLATVIDWTRQLLAKNGKIIAMKGREPNSELLAIPKDFEVTQTVSLKISGIDRERQIIVLERTH